MLDFLSKIYYASITEIFNNFSWINCIELIILIAFLLFVYIQFIRKSSSRKLFNGIAIIFMFYVFSRVLVSTGLIIIGRFLEGISTMLLFSIVVIFQPELRRFFGYLGQPGFIHKTFFAPHKENNGNENTVKELSDAIKYLSKSKIGALIVVQGNEDMTMYNETGTTINALISSELILTIFHPNTALHDGAMIITPNKIIAAGVLLPLTENPGLTWQYGTRHRAAIGITEISGNTCIVVSEETGFVSFAKEGNLTKIDTVETLNAELTKLILPETNQKKNKKPVQPKNIV